MNNLSSDFNVLDMDMWRKLAELEGLPKAVSEWYRKVAYGIPVKHLLLVTDRDG